MRNSKCKSYQDYISLFQYLHRDYFLEVVKASYREQIKRWHNQLFKIIRHIRVRHVSVSVAAMSALCFDDKKMSRFDSYHSKYACLIWTLISIGRELTS